MYCVRIVYPKKPGSSFNWDHYYADHLPLGLGLLAKHTGVKPVKIEIDQQITADGKDDNVPYHCICSAYFADQAGVDAMLGVFGVEEARQLLAEDWLKYTEADPELMVSEIVAVDPVTGRR